MNVYACNDAEGHWPVGFAAVVVAESEADARNLLWHEMLAKGLGDKNASNRWHLWKLDLTQPTACILVDGEY